MNENTLIHFNPSLKALWIVAIFLSLIVFFTMGLALFVILPYALYKYLQYKNTVYILTDQRLKFEWGIMSKHHSQLDLFRLKDIQFDQSFSQRMVNCGNLTILSTDLSSPIIQLVDIEYPKEVMEKIRSTSENRKETKRTGVIEYV